jgi:hypothetical protein
MAMKTCKECGKEVSSSAKICPSCGKDQRNFFMKHKFLTVIGALVVIGILSSLLGGGDNDKPTTTQSNLTQSTTNNEKPNTIKYGNGKYLVGKDIQSGLYKVTVTDKVMKMGYVERAKDVDMEMDSIIANIILTGNGYVEILSTDIAVKLQGVEITPIKIEDLKPAIKNEATDGIYLIGYDLAPGTYKVEVTDTATKMGYVERSKSVAMGMDDIIANEIIQGSGYVKILKDDFAVRLQGVKITIQQ